MDLWRVSDVRAYIVLTSANDVHVLYSAPYVLREALPAGVSDTLGGLATTAFRSWTGGLVKVGFTWTTRRASPLQLAGELDRLGTDVFRRITGVTRAPKPLGLADFPTLLVHIPVGVCGLGGCVRAARACVRGRDDGAVYAGVDDDAADAQGALGAGLTAFFLCCVVVVFCVCVCVLLLLSYSLCF